MTIYGLNKKAYSIMDISARRNAQTGLKMNLPISEKLLYGGISAMAAVAVLAVAGIIIFTLTGKKLRKKLEKEYGKPSVSQK